jgi:hypothetical protein
MTLRSRFTLAFASIALLLVLVPAVSHAGSIVTNGGFVGTAGWSSTQTNGNYPWTWGDGYASTGCIGETCITGGTGQEADLDQNLTTVAGDTYTLSFQYNPSDGTPTELAVYFGSTEAIDLVDVANSTVTYTISGLTATGTSTELTFLGRQDPGFDLLTDVSVVEGSGPVVPEPSSLVLLGSGLLALGGMARRKFNV